MAQIDRIYQSRTAIIPAGGSLAPAINLRQTLDQNNMPLIGNLGLVGILVPSNWTSAAISFQMSPDGINFGEAFSDSGSAYAVTAAAGNFVLLNPSAFASAMAIIIRSGTSGSPVVQNSAANLILALRGG